MAFGAPSTCTATVADTGAGGATAPTGAVSFTATGQGSLTSCTLAGGAGATASCSTTYVPQAPGTNTITADYGGDAAQHLPSSGTTTVTVGRRPTTTAVRCALSLLPFQPPWTCTATVTGTTGGGPTPTGTVTVTRSGPGGFFGPRSCTLTPTSPGAAQCSVTYLSLSYFETITASYGGDSTYLPSSATTTVRPFAGRASVREGDPRSSARRSYPVE